jgi:hypothetical protein
VYTVLLDEKSSRWVPQGCLPPPGTLSTAQSQPYFIKLHFIETIVRREDFRDFITTPFLHPVIAHGSSNP